MQIPFFMFLSRKVPSYIFASLQQILTKPITTRAMKTQPQIAAILTSLFM